MKNIKLIKSKIIFTPSIMMFLFSLLIILYNTSLNSPKLYIFPFIFTMLVGCYFFIKSLIYFLYTDIKLINHKNIIITSGILITKEYVIVLDKISDIEITKSLWGNIFSYGSLNLNYMNGNSFNLNFIKNTERLKTKILKIKEN